MLKVTCLLCGHSFPVREMEPMTVSPDWICRDRKECLDRQRERR